MGQLVVLVSNHHAGAFSLANLTGLFVLAVAMESWIYLSINGSDQFKFVTTSDWILH